MAGDPNIHTVVGYTGLLFPKYTSTGRLCRTPAVSKSLPTYLTGTETIPYMTLITLYETGGLVYCTCDSKQH